MVLPAVRERRKQMRFLTYGVLLVAATLYSASLKLQSSVPSSPSSLRHSTVSSSEALRPFPRALLTIDADTDADTNPDTDVTSSSFPFSSLDASYASSISETSLLGATQSCGDRIMHKFSCNATACEDKVGGYINYLYIHECVFSTAHLQGLSFFLLVLWMCFLLFMLGDTADEFFCPALELIVEVLHISPNIAGVTFLSFGNGAPDVFASLAAFVSGQGQIGVSAILGAGVFVTTVVVGCVALFSTVKLNRRPFLRDVGGYIIATLYLLWIFSDNKVHVGEALGFVALYLVFALVVIFGRKIYQRQKAARAKAISPDGEDTNATPLNSSYSPRQRSHSLSVGWFFGGSTTTPKDQTSDTLNTSFIQRSSSIKRAAEEDAAVIAQGQSTPTRHVSFDHRVVQRHKASHARPPLFAAHKHWTLRFAHSLSIANEEDDEEDDGERVFDFVGSLNAGTPDASNGEDDDDQESPGLCERWFGDDTGLRKGLDIILLPSSLIRRVSVPCMQEEVYDWRFLVCTPFFGTVLGILTAVGKDSFVGPAFGGPSWFTWYLVAIVIGAIGSALVFFLIPSDQPPKGPPLVVLILFAFLISVVWIIILANEIVSLVSALGSIIGISDSVLGLTVVAWGNSLGDLVADVTVAKEGFPEMGLAAAYAGPMFNLLMGLGLSLTVGTLKASNGVLDLQPAPGTEHRQKTMHITILCFVFLLISLVGTFIYVPLDKFRIRRFYGYYLIVLYVVYLATCLAVQLG